MTELGTNRDRDSLKSFRVEAVWGNAQAFLKQDLTTGVEYIDLTGHRYAFQVLLGPAVKDQAKILVREEYRTALHELETNHTYRHGAYITGQPGIGKTLFLAYILVKHLGQRRTVAWQDTTGRQFYVLFRDTATFYSLADPTPLYDYGPLWALSESNAGVQVPHPPFIARTMSEPSRLPRPSKAIGRRGASMLGQCAMLWIFGLRRKL
ncbi:hypothetical protein OG21DRAFT_1010570 [Imleria badia]|nr:hypothetical protein OG21DRAFT_1010570 [Imleria badia]